MPELTLVLQVVPAPLTEVQHRLTVIVPVEYAPFVPPFHSASAAALVETPGASAVPMSTPPRRPGRACHTGGVDQDWELKVSACGVPENGLLHILIFGVVVPTR